MKLFKHQIDTINEFKGRKRVAAYLDMGLGKTYVGSEYDKELNEPYTLVICQKSKVNDWLEHYKSNYDFDVFDLTNKKEFVEFIKSSEKRSVGIINYDLVFRRTELTTFLNLVRFTLMLDESSCIQNENAKRSKFILKRLYPRNVILLSGTPTSGRYERLWSQCQLLGWDISKRLFYDQYVIEAPITGWNGRPILTPSGYPIKHVVGYKNVDRLKAKLREHGAVFMKSDEVLTLPEQNFIDIKVDTDMQYRKFMRSGVVDVADKTLVGDTTLTKLLYARMLCGHYNKDKLQAFEDLVESTNDRLIVFYNFNDELSALKEIAKRCDRPISIVNGEKKDLSNYENCDDSLTLIQYQAGSMGLNLQKANKIIYFTPTLSSELFEQSKKRIHRIGQNHPCFYYLLTCGVEHKIYDTLKMRKDYTDYLFKNDFLS